MKYCLYGWNVREMKWFSLGPVNSSWDCGFNGICGFWGTELILNADSKVLEKNENKDILTGCQSSV